MKVYFLEFERDGHTYKVECSIRRQYTRYDVYTDTRYYNEVYETILFKKVKGLIGHKWRKVFSAIYGEHEVKAKSLQPAISKFIELYFEGSSKQ